MTAHDVTKRGDGVTLTYRVNGDLTGRTATWLARPRPGATPALTKPCQLVDAGPEGSTVTVTLAPADTAVSGNYYLEIQAIPTTGDPIPTTYPSDGYGLLTILDDLS